MFNIGIIGCADIAYRKFIPAAQKSDNVKVVLVASERNVGKLNDFYVQYGLEGTDSYDKLISRDDIDAVYIPQPPARHYEIAKSALLAGKHVLLEKPLTINMLQSEELIELAKEKDLVIYENYMFTCHRQLREIKKVIESGELGKVRMIESRFGFPFRGVNDFRYKKELGGGALLDAGGYTVKLATELLGERLEVKSAFLSPFCDGSVDVFGNFTMVSEDNILYSASFGMDCQYQCNLFVWGSKGTLICNRIFTAPADYDSGFTVTKGNESSYFTVGQDDHFYNSIQRFVELIKDEKKREQMYNIVYKQSKLMSQVMDKAEQSL